MLDEATKAAVHDAIGRVLSGRERVPGDLPYPSSVREYMLAAAFPDEDPKRVEWMKAGRNVGRATMRVYVAGWFAGRECDSQISGQLREWFGDGPHPYVGLAVCLVCDGPWHDNDQAEAECDQVELVFRRLVEHETDPCDLDHNGYCQAHSLHSSPCPVPVARELLGLTEEVQGA